MRKPNKSYDTTITQADAEKIKYFWDQGFGSAKISLLTDLDSYKVRRYLVTNGLTRTKEEALEAKLRANKSPYAARANAYTEKRQR